MADRLKHLIVLAADLLGRWVHDERVSHEHYQPLNAHAIGKREQLGDPLLRRAGHAA